MFFFTLPIKNGTSVLSCAWDFTQPSIAWGSSIHENSIIGSLMNSYGVAGGWSANAIENKDALGYQRPALYKIC